jgi:phage-related protein
MLKPWLQVLIYDPARKEILHWPLEAKKDLGSILTKLQKGAEVGFPDTEPFGTIASGVFEIRVKEASGIFRTFYLVKRERGILVFHAFKKKTQKTPKQEIDTARKRLNQFLKELEDEG